MLYLIYRIIARRALVKIAIEFEKKLIDECNQVNGKLSDMGIDNPVIDMSRNLANTVFIDSHKNEKFRARQLDKICSKCGLEKGLQIYFRRPLNFIKLGNMFLA